MFMSYDHGVSWSCTLILPSDTFYTMSMSAVGKYITATVLNRAVYVSDNFGQNWTTISNDTTGLGFAGGNVGARVCVSASGQTQVATAFSSIVTFVSNSSGSSWTASLAPQSPLQPQKQGECDMSSDGQVIALVTLAIRNTSTTFRSNYTYLIMSYNAGRSWSIVPIVVAANSLPITQTTHIGLCVAVSSSGQYVTTLTANTAANAGGLVFVSNTSGLNWTYVARVNGSAGAANGFVAMSRSGQYQVASVRGGPVYRSTNFGLQWAVVNGTDCLPVKVGNSTINSQWLDITISGSGQYQVIQGSSSNIVSMDYGATWQYI